MNNTSTSPDGLKQADNRLYLQIAAIYLLIIVAVYTVEMQPWPSAGFFLSSLLAWAAIGWGQFALFNALHEGLHKRMGAPHREFVGLLLTAWPLGFSASYRQLHLNHHKFFGHPQRDPDYNNYANFPSHRRAFIARLLLNISGIAAARQFLGMLGEGKAETSKNTGGGFFPVIATQLLLLGIFAATAGWLYYFWLWLVPLATFAKFFTSTRTFCEHASPDNQAVIRTITGSFLGEKVFGVFNFHYHAEHHRFVGIPCSQLPRAHNQDGGQLFRQQEAGTEHYEHFDRGYFGLLVGWYRALSP